MKTPGVPVPKRGLSFSRRLALSLLGLAGLICGTLLLLATHPEEGTGLPCVFYGILGVYCPGCGIGRAVSALFRGELYEAFRWNPAFLILAPWLLFYGVWRTTEWVLGWESRIDRIIPAKLLIGILIVLVVFAVLRNIPVWPLTALRPGG